MPRHHRRSAARRPDLTPSASSATLDEQHQFHRHRQYVRGYNRYAGSAGGVAEEIVGKAVRGAPRPLYPGHKGGHEGGRRSHRREYQPRGHPRSAAPQPETHGHGLCRCLLPAPLRPRRTEPPGRRARAMGDELRAGTIRAWGVSNYTAAQLAALLGGKGRGVPARAVPACAEPAQPRRAGRHAAAVEKEHRRRAVSGAPTGDARRENTAGDGRARGQPPGRSPSGSNLSQTKPIQCARRCAAKPR